MATKVLLVEDDPGDARLLQDMLAAAGPVTFEKVWVPRLADALAHLARRDTDVVLLDLGLPDSQGLDTLARARAAAPWAPLVVLSEKGDEATALEALHQGAQDCLVKREADSSHLQRAIIRAIARSQAKEAPRFAPKEPAQQTTELARAHAALQEQEQRGRRAEAALAEAEARNRAIFENTGAGTAIVGEDGAILFANSEFARIAGYSRRKMEGKKRFEELVAGANLAKILEYFRLRRAHPARAPRSYEFRLRNRQGRLFDILLTGSPIPGTEKRVVTLLDLTDRKNGETALKLARNNLESKVAVRTAELAQANEELHRKVAETREAKESLEAERQRLYALLDGLPAFVYLKSADYFIRFANKTFKELFGDTADKRCYEAFGWPTPCADCKPFLVFKTGSPQTFEWTKPQSSQTFEVHNYPFVDVDGSPLVLTLGIDISQRRRMEEALRESEQQYRALVNTVPAVVFRGYADWSVDFFDDKIEALTGFTREDFASRRIKWCDLIPPEDLQYAGSVFLEALRGSKAYVREHRIRAKSGEMRWVQCRGQIICDAAGKVDYISGMTFDITAHKQVQEALEKSEQKFRFLVNTIPAVLFRGYADGAVDFFDNKVELLTGYSKEEFDSRRLRWTDLILAEDRGAAKEAFLQALQGDRSYVREYRITHKNGSIIWIQGRGQIFVDPEGKIDHISGVLFNVSERKQAEEKLRESEKNLRYLASQLLTAQERERKRISRELHDDLGQSLLTLKLKVRSAERKISKGPEAVKEECKEMALFLDRIVEDVRRLSRDLSPSLLEDLGLSPALNRLIDEFIRHHRLVADLQGMDEIEDLFPPEAQISIYRIFQEALTNIGKYAAASRLAVKINRGRDHVEFMVADNGRGFNPVQVLTGGAADRGLGLAAMEERVRMLGGTWKIESREGVGTTISFTVPVAAREREEPPHAPGSSSLH